MPQKTEAELAAEAAFAKTAEEAKRRAAEMEAKRRADVGKGPETSQNSGEQEFGEEDKLEAMLEKLVEHRRKEYRTSRITNAGYETGRPLMRIPSNLRGDSSNMYNMLSIDDLYAIKPKAVSNNMATTEDMAKVKVSLEALGVPTEEVSRLVAQAAIYCKDTSSSEYMDPRGTFETSAGAISMDAVFAVLKTQGGTLRRVCRLYAAITWNYMLLHEAPPSDWSAMGFKRNERFAAFDCLDYVENSAAIPPKEGLIRKPTSNEYIAHNTYKRIALDRSNRNEVFGNLQTEITGGRFGDEIERNHLQSKK